MDLVSKAYFIQGFLRPLPAFGFSDAGDGQGQFYICQDGLMGDQVVALEAETNGVVPVGVPVPVFVFPCGDSVDKMCIRDRSGGEM